MASNSPSAALENFPQDLKEEYDELFHRIRGELAAVEGMSVIQITLLERYVFTYAMIRYLERDIEHLDLQRYNQLSTIWLRMASDLLEKYKEIAQKGAIKDVFVAKIMSVVGEEVDDPEVLRRIRGRLAQLAKEPDED